MTSNKATSYTGPGTASLLGILFIGLKLTGYINWPWVWVLAPFWIPFLIVLSMLVVGGLLLLTAWLLDQIIGK
jgi:uncharacterized protein (DUF983 family)